MADYSFIERMNAPTMPAVEVYMQADEEQRKKYRVEERKLLAAKDAERDQEARLAERRLVRRALVNARPNLLDVLRKAAAALDKDAAKAQAIVDAPYGTVDGAEWYMWKNWAKVCREEAFDIYRLIDRIGRSDDEALINECHVTMHYAAIKALGYDKGPDSYYLKFPNNPNAVETVNRFGLYSDNGQPLVAA